MKKLIVLMLAVVLLQACEKDDVSPNQLLKNTDVEKSLGTEYTWWNNGRGSNFTAEWTEENSFSTSHSLKLSRTTVDVTNFWYWGQNYTGVIPVGKELKLKVKIKAVDLAGYGASIAIRCDDASTGLQFESTQDKLNIKGTFDWTEYTVSIGSVNSEVTNIYVFLIYLTNTTGAVYFDDITLTYQ